jgi:hypothetical protein
VATLRRSGLPQPQPPPAPQAPEPARLGEGQVVIRAPRPFNILLPDGKVHRQQAGTHVVERYIAEHWYAKANGVQIVAQGAKKES